MTALPDRFLDAMRTFDADAMAELLAPDAAIWRNIGNKSRRPEEIVDTLRAERVLVRSSSLIVRHQSTTQDGFVVQFVFEGTTRGGAHFHIPICIVARVENDRITGFEEYADETSLQPLLQEFLGSAQPAPDPLA